MGQYWRLQFWLRVRGLGERLGDFCAGFAGKAAAASSKPNTGKPQNPDRLFADPVTGKLQAPVDSSQNCFSRKILSVCSFKGIIWSF